LTERVVKAAEKSATRKFVVLDEDARARPCGVFLSGRKVFILILPRRRRQGAMTIGRGPAGRSLRRDEAKSA